MDCLQPFVLFRKNERCSANLRFIDNSTPSYFNLAMMKIGKIPFVALFVFLSPSRGEAGNWTKGMKEHSEFKEVVAAMRTWENGNLLRSLELKESTYTIKTEKCEFSVKFEYQQSDPEKAIKRKLLKTLMSGNSTDCSGFFKD